MGTEHFDIVIIGAGIHGAGIAQAAACYGYRVLVLEKRGIAAGTSSRSSKLIHGGLRYLETGQFALVRECLRERNLLLQLAPELVRMVPFCIPVYEDSVRAAGTIRLGLGIYALLSGLRRLSKFTAIPRRQWEELDGLTTVNLRKVFQYYDAQTDDQALTKAVLQSALNLGAELRVPARFIGADIGDLCEVRFLHDGKDQVCTAKILINAAGPWVNEVLQKITPPPTTLPVDLVQGTHVVLNRPAGNRVYYLEAPQDRRAVFVMPWKNQLMVGTTETAFHNSPDKVEPLESEVAYLLNTFARYFPATHLLPQDIVEQFAGLRVLPSAETSAFRRSRDTVIHLDNTESPKLVSLYGGKLTAYRATAEKVIHRILPALPHKKPLADTRRLHLRPA